MEENTSLPASIRERLQLVQQHAQMGQTGQAQSVLQEMARTLATTAPELAGLSIIASLGRDGYEICEESGSTHQRELVKTVLGMSIEVERETISTSHFVRKWGSLKDSRR